MNIDEKKQRIIARGEFSDHAHVVIGGAISVDASGKLILTVENDGDAAVNHIKESAWLEGRVVEAEHAPIPYQAGVYYLYHEPQTEYDPYQDIIVRVQD